jgi:hypothetical protein
MRFETGRCLIVVVLQIRRWDFRQSSEVLQQEGVMATVSNSQIKLKTQPPCPSGVLCGRLSEKNVRERINRALQGSIGRQECSTVPVPPALLQVRHQSVV